MATPQLQPCFVIHRRDYRNTSLLLELFTPDEGRIPAIARGAKSGRAVRATLLQPFRPLLVGMAGRGELKTLSQVEPEGRAFALSGRALYSGFYLNELLMRLLVRNDSHPEIFSSYLEVLAGLVSGEPVQDWLRYFEVRLLKGLGYELLLDRDAQSGEPIEAGATYDFLIEQGAVRSKSQSVSSPLQIDGRTLLCLHHRAPMDAQTRQQAKGLMRRVLAFYLGDKPLKSRELFLSSAQIQS